jgi:hypothetical protein
MRWIARALYGVLVVTWLSVVFVWIYSYWFGMYVGVTSSKGSPVHFITSNSGVIAIFYYPAQPMPHPTHYVFQWIPQMSTSHSNIWRVVQSHLAFGWCREGSSQDPRRQTVVIFPHWALATLLLLLWAIPLIGRWRLARRRRPAFRCTGCGYDLTGNASGRCPECGSAVTQARPTQA